MIKGDRPLVSVLMTAFNRENYIREAIESVLSSTYENFELIIVDDRSQDNTLTIAKEFARKDARIKVYSNRFNLGDYNNRNEAAKYANGKYLKYWDSDDIMYPHCLETMVRCMLEFPKAELGLIKPHLPCYNRPYPCLIENPLEEFFKHGHLVGNSPGSSIISTDLFKKLNGFSGEEKIGDYDFWLRCMVKTQFVLIPAFLGWDREHEGQEKNICLAYYDELRLKVLMRFVNSLNQLSYRKKRDFKKGLLNSRFKLIVLELMRLNFHRSFHRFKNFMFIKKYKFK